VSRRLSRDEAATLLDAGEVVAVATDTVYGLAASLARPAAVARLFSIKSRPTTVALPVLVASPAAIEGLGVAWPAPARALADAFWPGALTIVVAVPPALATLVGAEESVGFRVPDDATLRGVLDEVGPLAVTSANEHGRPPCRDAEEVLAAFAGRDDLAGVLDDGRRDGEVSTVVALEDDGWRVVRHGALGEDDLARVLG
jgi:tRNA threonylcarbamoyl adenosine modification protein (Sua5/YciO/YrdC/YwlC family)